MERTNKIVAIWLLILIGYILHPQYYLSGLFYGINVRLKDATGTVPQSSHIMHLVFDIVPMLLILLTLYLKGRIFKLTLLVITALFLAANGYHFFETVSEDGGNISQLALIGLIFILNLVLFVETFKWWKNKV